MEGFGPPFFMGERPRHLVSEQRYSERMTICNGCTYFHKKRCLGCGCFMEMKAKAKSTACPLHRWPAIAPDQE